MADFVQTFTYPSIEAPITNIVFVLPSGFLCFAAYKLIQNPSTDW